jgi:hypothetical protein
MSEEYESRTYTPPRAISPEERQRQQIQDAVNAAMRTANAQYQHNIAFLNQKHNEEMERLNQKISTLEGDIRNRARMRQKQFEKLREEYVKNINKAMSDAEKRRQQDRRQFEKDLNEAVNSINDHIDDIRKSTQEAIDATNETLRKLHIETSKALENQQQQIDDIVEEYHSDKKKSAIIRKSLTEEYNSQVSIIELLNHRKYAPGQLDDIVSEVGDTKSVTDDAAIAILHTGINKVLLLKAKIEQAQLEYETRHALTLKAAESVLARMNENRKNVSLTDGNNNVVRKDNGEIARIELDFWTEGEYGKLERQLNEIKKDIVDGLDSPKYTMNDLEEALQKIESIDTRQNELVIESIKRGNASQIRAEMADAIAEHLESQRFHVVECGYENGDARNAYFIKFDDGTSELVIVINPENIESNIVIRKTVDTDLAEPDLIQLNENIDNVLKDSGVSTMGGACKKRNHNADAAWREIYDMDIVCQEIPSETKERARIKDFRKESNNYNG